MIAVDTSALMAIVQGEPAGPACLAAIDRNDRIIMSAATLAETLIVADRRGKSGQMAHVLESLRAEVIELTEGRARRAADAYRRWGRGVHPAALNFGDCFAYALAEEYRCPLLFVGEDFAKTDVKACLHPSRSGQAVVPQA